MFANTIKNSIARHVLSRIHAIRMAEEKFDIYVQAATVVEAINWTSDKMNEQHRIDKEYNTLHKFWVKLNKIKDNKFRQYIYDCDGRYAVQMPRTCVSSIWVRWKRFL